MKKVIVFSSHTTLESGGVGTHLKHLIQELNKSGFNTSVILGARKFDLMKIKVIKLLCGIFTSKSNIEILYLNLYILALKRALNKEIVNSSNEVKEIVVHCHDKYTSIATLLLRNNCNVRVSVVQTLHAPFTEEYRITKTSALQFIEYAKVLDAGSSIGIDKLIAVDALQCEIVKETVSFDESNIVRIANAVDVSELNGVISSKQDRKYFVVARHLQTKNGVIFAVKAFREFLKTNIEYDLILMGEGPERENIEKFVRESNISQYVKFFGRRNHDESLSIIKGATASIIPSIPVGRYIEATSLTMLESMYLEVPVIASNIGGLAEVIISGESGLLFEPKDTEELFVLMNKIISDSNLLNQIKANGKREILNSYSSENWFRKISECY